MNRAEASHLIILATSFMNSMINIYIFITFKTPCPTEVLLTAVKLTFKNIRSYIWNAEMRVSVSAYCVLQFSMLSVCYSQVPPKIKCEPRHVISNNVVF